MSIQAGQELLHYRLIEKIGEGGMGVVWKALDTSLDREVAVKILPESVAGDAQRLARFEREAKLLASLNHPNVATVYGVHEHDGVRFLAMELVPGEDLADRLRRGRMNVEQAACIGGRILEALEAAHAQGVIHRDLKPANIRVTSEGSVKILDFGLAKGAGPCSDVQDPAQSPTITSAGSMPGALLGTVAYMSPEQARGHEADVRSDVWAFGCVLWECLTGKQLFAEKTLSDTIAAVLGREPDWSKLPGSTPSNVERLLRRCLVKDATLRLHHVADARIELQDVEKEPTPSFAAAHARRIANGAVALSLVLGAALLWSLWPTTSSSGGADTLNPLEGARFTRLTDFPGSEFDAAISPDGRFISFVSDHDGAFDVFVNQIGTSQFNNLSKELDSDQVNYVREVKRAGFNADGTEIWLGGGLGRRMRSVPFLGGRARNFLSEDAVNVSWSPDGRRVVYHERTPGDPLYVADGDGSNARKILAPAAGVHQHFPVWSVDGEWIYLSRGRPFTGEVNLWRVRPDGSDPEQLTDRELDVRYPVPIDDKTVLFTARDVNGAGPWIWAVDVESKETRRVTVGLERFSSIAASNDRRRLVATVEDPLSELWSVPILDRVATEDDAGLHDASPGRRALAPRFKGGDLYFLSSHGGGDGLWRLRDGELAEIWRGANAALFVPPAISPDGASIALLVRQDGKRRLHVITSDGAQRRLLTERVDGRGSIDWSPDGRWLVIGGSVDGVQGLFKVPVDGSEPHRIVDGEALNPVWSPDGKLIVYSGEQVAASMPLLAVDPDGNEVPWPELEVLRGGERYRFMPDGSALIFMRGVRPAQDFYRLDLSTRDVQPLTNFNPAATMRTFDITPDGKRIVFDRMRDNSDIVLIELDPERRP